MKPIRIGTRGSALALYQAEVVKTSLQVNFPMFPVEIIRIKTSGDMIRRGGLSQVETKRVFTREIEDALLSREVDVAVHSAKDLAVVMPEGLEIGAVLERDDARDCLISRDRVRFSELPMGTRIGTSSLRRKLQLLRWNPELIIEDVRGNVDTRVKKVEEGVTDAIVLAHAGIKRLGLQTYVSEIFPEDRFYPAPGQGAILVQMRSGDAETAAAVKAMHHAESGVRVLAERAFLRKLEGGCQLPCGIFSRLEGERLMLRGAIFAVRSRHWIEKSWEGPVDGAEAGGEALAGRIIESGGREILNEIYEDFEKKDPPA